MPQLRVAGCVPMAEPTFHTGVGTLALSASEDLRSATTELLLNAPDESLQTAVETRSLYCFPANRLGLHTRGRWHRSTLLGLRMTLARQRAQGTPSTSCAPVATMSRSRPPTWASTWRRSWTRRWAPASRRRSRRSAPASTRCGAVRNTVASTCDVSSSEMQGQGYEKLLDCSSISLAESGSLAHVLLHRHNTV